MAPDLGDPEVSAAWTSLKAAATALQGLQVKDGSVPEPADHPAAAEHVRAITESVEALTSAFPHDADYLRALVADFERWAGSAFGVPDFLDSLVEFHPERHRVDGLRHLVVFPMYTQNGSTNRYVEAVLRGVIWPDFVARLEAGDWSNKLFVPVRFLDFTPGYDTDSAVLFPESVAMREIPTFTWGAIFADREAARFRRVVEAAARVTNLDLPEGLRRMLADQRLAEEVFVMWDLIHDRTHMRGDLPFDPFMIKQRMPFFLYSLEEMRCDLTAYRAALAIEQRVVAAPEPTDEELLLLDRARLVQFAILFDRIFRFAITGTRVRNYDGLGGQLLFAWLHRGHVLHWTDTSLAFDWADVPARVSELGDAIDRLYWESIDRPKTVHWLRAYDLVSSVVEPHPASAWKRGDLPLDGLPKELTDKVMDDEFPLSMFYEAFAKKMGEVIASTRGITGASTIA
jgi:hypothetical protein